MRTRRAGKHKTFRERMIEQFQPGMYVVCTYLDGISDSLRGVVEKVDIKCLKVYVAWNGGPVKQHDPEEIMPAVMPVGQTSNVESDSARNVVMKPKEASMGRRMRRKALYHSQRGRMYRRTREEQDLGTVHCPKCSTKDKKVDMEKHPFMKGVKIYICPKCGWKIPTNSIV